MRDSGKRVRATKTEDDEQRTVPAVVERDAFGNPKRVVACESEEAASHWDERLWSRVR